MYSKINCVQINNNKKQPTYIYLYRSQRQNSQGVKRSRHRCTQAPPVAEGLKLARRAGGTRSRGAERTNTNLIAARVCGRGFSSRCRHGSRRRCAAGANLSPSRGREGYALLLSISRTPGARKRSRDARKTHAAA